MENSIIIVGELIECVEMRNNSLGLIIKVDRLTKNCCGMYEYDYIPVLGANVIPKKNQEELEKGMTIGVRGRLEKREAGWFVIGDKITYISKSSK